MNHEKTLLVLFIRPWHSWNILTSVDWERQSGSRLVHGEGHCGPPWGGGHWNILLIFSQAVPYLSMSGESHWKDSIGPGRGGALTESCNSVQTCICVTLCECRLPKRWCVSTLWARQGGRHASGACWPVLSASVSLSPGRVLVGRTVLLLLKIEEILKSAGRGEDKYSISVFLPILLFSTAFHLSWDGFLSCQLQQKIIAYRFYQIGPLIISCTYYYFFSCSETFVQGPIRWS